MRLLDDEPSGPARAGGDWCQHRRHRSPGAGPPQDGVLGLASFVLARTPEVAVAVRGATADSDGLRRAVAPAAGVAARARLPLAGPARPTDAGAGGRRAAAGRGGLVAPGLGGRLTRRPHRASVTLDG